MTNERTVLFLMCNLGVEMGRLFSYEKDDVDMLNMAADRCRKIISDIYQKDGIVSRRMELEKIEYVMDDRIHFRTLQIDKRSIDSYFEPFVIKFYSTQ